MLKRIVISSMLFLLLAIVTVGIMYNPPLRLTATQAAQKIAINNIILAAPPLTENDITYLPLRAICEHMGYSLTKENSTNSIKIEKDNTIITLSGSNATIERREYKLARKKALATPLLTKNDTTYISMQDMRDIFQIHIDKESITINISYNTASQNYITFSDGLGQSTIELKYRDEYFNSTAFEYSPEIAELCIALASGAHAMSSLNNAYKNMGYAAEFYNYATINRQTSAYSIATKELSDKKIYIITIRGTSGDEWYTNFDIYKNKNTPSAIHYGFSQAEKNVNENLEKLLEEDNYKGRRIFLITGHSRGGAVANLLGARLAKEGKYTKPQDVYTYTFATPNVSIDADTAMKNIFNFCNASDFITKLPMNGQEYDPKEKEWLYKKNGTTIVFDNTDVKQTGLTADMESEFKAITGREFIEIKKNAVQTAILSLKALLPKVNDYYTKPLGIGSLQMSAYEFFIGGLAASQTLGAAAEKGMMIIADGLFKGDISELSKFIVFNSAGNSKKNSDGSITEKGQGIKYNHSCEAYYTWVKAYNKQYFNR